MIRLAAAAVAFAGAMLTAVALPYQSYELTNSTLAVGLLSIAEVLPAIALALVAGTLAGGRRALGAASLCATLATAVLLANATLDHPHTWVLYVAALLAGVSFTLVRPLLFAHRSDAALILGPGVGGLLIAAGGVGTAYAVDIALFAVALAAFAAVGLEPPAAGSRLALGEGLRYARARPEVGGSYLVYSTAVFFSMPAAVYPTVAERYGGASVLGVIAAAPAAGALLALRTRGSLANVRRHGRAMALFGVAWGAAIVGFGAAGALWLVLVLLAAAGAADALFRLVRADLWRRVVPDHMRGSLAGLEMASWTSAPALGNVEAGAVAATAGVRASIVSGGLLCVISTGVLAAALPRFWRYESSD